MRGAMNDEKNAPEWEKIKQWVGSRQPQRKDPIQQIAERGDAEIQHFDEGGSVLPSDSLMAGFPDQGDSSDFMQGAAAKAAAPMGGVPPAVSPAAPMAPPALPVAPRAPVAPVAPAPMQPSPTAPGAPSMTDQDFTHLAENEMGGVSPEKLAEMLGRAYKPSGGELVGMGFAGLGDAIASVGGRNPGAMKTAEEMINKRRDAQMAIPEKMAGMGKQRYELSRQLQSDDPRSPLSKSAQNTYRGDLVQLGFSPEEIGNMNLTNIHEATAIGADVGKIRAEMKMKAIELGQKGQEIAETGRHNAASEGIEGEKLQESGQEEVAKHYLTHPLNAIRANKALANESGVGTPVQIHTTQDWKNLKPGTRYMDSHGTVATKK